MQPSLNFVFINGRNAAGKDTQAELMVKRHPEAVQISTGDLYRNGKNPDNKYHGKIAPHIEAVSRGQLLPDSVILGIVDEEINDYRIDGKTSFIFTGFPRTVDQLHAVDEWVQRYEKEGNKVKVDHVALMVFEGRVFTRSENRKVNALIRGEKSRDDDEPEVVRRRLQVYTDQTLPMLHELFVQGRLHTINSNRPGVPEVYSALSKSLEAPARRRISERK